MLLWTQAQRVINSRDPTKPKTNVFKRASLTPGHPDYNTDPSLFLFSERHTEAISPPTAECLSAALQDSQVRRGETSHLAMLQTLATPDSARSLRSLPWGGNETMLAIKNELPRDGNLFSQWVGGRQASSERVSELVDEPEASRARPTAEQASAALENTPAATSTVVERKEMTRSLGSRIWSRVRRWLGVHTDVMTEVSEVIEDSAGLIPEMTQMVDRGARTLDEIDAVYQATRTTRCSERTTPYPASQAFA